MADPLLMVYIKAIHSYDHRKSINFVIRFSSVCAPKFINASFQAAFYQIHRYQIGMWLIRAKI